MRMLLKKSIPKSTPTINFTPEKPVLLTSMSALSWFTQATIILALIPFFGYLFSLAFEASYCGYFSIPSYFISLSPTLVLSLAIGTVAPFYPTIISLFLIIILAPPLVKVVAKNRKRRSVVMFFLLIYLFIDALLNPDPTVLKNIGWIAIISYIAGWILLIFKKEEIWWNETLIDINNAQQTWVSSLYNPRVSILFFTILVFIVLGIKTYNFLGKDSAERQEAFHVFISESIPSEVAVIRNYGDYLYAVPFNRTTKEFEKKLVIIKMSESAKSSLTLSLEMIGPLKEISSKAVP